VTRSLALSKPLIAVGGKDAVAEEIPHDAPNKLSFREVFKALQTDARSALEGSRNLSSHLTVFRMYSTTAGSVVIVYRGPPIQLEARCGESHKCRYKKPGTAYSPNSKGAIVKHRNSLSKPVEQAIPGKP
jgi:hypothetical protein